MHSVSISIIILLVFVLRAPAKKLAASRTHDLQNSLDELVDNLVDALISKFVRTFRCHLADGPALAKNRQGQSHGCAIARTALPVLCSPVHIPHYPFPVLCSAFPFSRHLILSHANDDQSELTPQELAQQLESEPEWIQQLAGLDPLVANLTGAAAAAKAESTLTKIQAAVVTTALAEAEMAAVKAATAGNGKEAAEAAAAEAKLAAAGAAESAEGTVALAEAARATEETIQAAVRNIRAALPKIKAAPDSTADVQAQVAVFQAGARVLAQKSATAAAVGASEAAAAAKEAQANAETARIGAAKADKAKAIAMGIPEGNQTITPDITHQRSPLAEGGTNKMSPPRSPFADGDIAKS